MGSACPGDLPDSILALPQFAVPGCACVSGYVKEQPAMYCLCHPCVVIASAFHPLSCPGAALPFSLFFWKPEQ